MSRITLRRTAALAAIAAGAVAVAAPTAGAAQVGVADGRTTLQLDAGTAAALGDAGIRVAPVRPASAGDAGVAFPITGGRIDPETAAGVVTHSGGLTFSDGDTDVSVTDFTVRVTGAPFLIASVGDARVALLNIDASDATVSRGGAGGIGTTVSGARATLRAEAARALNAAFGTHLAPGTPIGRVTLDARPAQVLLEGGSTSLALDAGTARALTGLGVTPSPIAPATAEGALRFPITGGRLDAETLAGRIDHSGGIALTAGATRVALSGFRINVRPRANLTAQVGEGPTRVGLVLDLSDATTSVRSRRATVSGVKVSLSEVSAGALNGAFGVTALTPGLPLGTAEVRADIR